MKSILLRVLLLAGFTVAAIVLFLPSTPAGLPSFWKDNVPKITLGLDLQGGMHLALDVDQEKAVENHTARIADSVEATLREKGVPYVSVVRSGTQSIEVVSPGKDAQDSVAAIVADEHPSLTIEKREGDSVFFTLSGDETKRVMDWAVTQALETIRNRVDKFGVAEPTIQRQGEREIVVQLPGLKDPRRAISLIGKTAVLEFRLLEERYAPEEAVRVGAPFGSELLYGKSEQGRVERVPYLVKKEILLTGEAVSDARVSFDPQFNEPYVALTFDRTGARVFDRITERNVGKRLAIILDDVVHSAPVIRERISGGNAQISGGFTTEEATDLAIALRAGALPAPVNIIQNVTVGPTLGRDSIEAGIKAAIGGAALVVIFMVLYYRVSGVIADIAIALNIIMLLGVMAYFNATLTLPGIAGIILTVGMGVDSNVLIFERIKEELRSGRTVRSAIHAGYDRAWWTIVDSHVTTLITAAALFQFGSGPIKGFAVTLSTGILINLFTALVGTKLAFDLQTDKLKISRLSI